MNINIFRAFMNAGIADTQSHCTRFSRLNRRLVELHEYAAREGITPQQVTECSEIGILQLRRHKGKTFVVDMPISSLDQSDTIDAEVASLIGRLHTNEPTAPASPAEPQTIEEKSGKEPENTPAPTSKFEPGSISKLVQQMLKEADEIKAEHPDIYEETTTEQSIAETCPQTEQVIGEMLKRLEQIQDRLNIPH